MDRGRQAVRCAVSRLPRERGDGPKIADEAEAKEAPPPRARGWTAVNREWGRLRPASPASAGMDRTRGADSVRDTGLPRERGDGPHP